MSQRTLEKHFATLDQYKSGFRSMLRDKRVRRLQQDFLRPLRNKAGFHVAREVFQKTLRDLTSININSLPRHDGKLDRSTLA